MRTDYTTKINAVQRGFGVHEWTVCACLWIACQSELWRRTSRMWKGRQHMGDRWETIGTRQVSENGVGTRYSQGDRHAGEHTGGGHAIPLLENSDVGVTIDSTFIITTNQKPTRAFCTFFSQPTAGLPWASISTTLSAQDELGRS